MLVPAETYIVTVATADHDREIAVAKAERDYAENEDAEARDEAITAAYEENTNLTQQADRTYRAAEASALGIRVFAEASATLWFASSIAGASQARRVDEANAIFNYQSSDIEAYVVLTEELAGIDQVYLNFEADTLATMAATLATTVTTPWSVQYAAAQAAYETRTTATAAAQYDKQVDQSIAQGVVELAVASEEANLQIEYANLQYALDMAYALGTYAAAAARGMRLLAGANAGTLGTELPALSSTAGLPSYAIPTDGNASYYVGNVGYWGWGWPYYTYSYWGFGYASPWYGNYFGGNWSFGYHSGLEFGYYGYTNFGGYGFGYYSPYYYGSPSYAYYTQWGTGQYGVEEPAEQNLPGGFWDLFKEFDSINDGVALGDFPDVAGLVFPAEIPAAPLPAPTFSDEESPTPAEMDKQVAAALEAVNVNVASFWSRLGHVTHTAVAPQRPDLAISDNLQEVSIGELLAVKQRVIDSFGAALNAVYLAVPKHADAGTVAGQVLATATADVAGNVTAGRLQAGIGKVAEARNQSGGMLDPMLFMPTPREMELMNKVEKLLQTKVTVGGVVNGGLNFLGGYFKGLGDGFVEGLPGMTWWGLKMYGKALAFEAKVLNWYIRNDPRVRITGYLYNGKDIAAEANAEADKAVREFGNKVVALAGKTKEAVEQIVTVAGEVKTFLDRQGNDLATILANGDKELFESKISGLSRLAKESMRVAGMITTEILHFVVDHLKPYDVGYLCGRIAYEVIEDVVLTQAIIAAEAATFGAATPAAGAALSAKGLTIIRVLENLRNTKLVKHFDIIKPAITQLQNLATWMMKYPVCFVAGTKVHTRDGLKNIEDIREGDLVLTRRETAPDEAPHYGPVLNTVVTRPKRLYHLRFVVEGTKTFETISGTGEHPFYAINRNEFVPAKELVQGDRFALADGRTALLTEVAQEDAADGETFTTYNFEVAEDHTYFVGAAGVWVHNAGNPCDEAFDVFVKAKHSGVSDTDALLAARKHINGISGISDVERTLHLTDLDNALKKAIQWEVLEKTDALQLAGPNRGLIFVRETASMPAHARRFQDETLGSFPGIAPTLRYDNPFGGDNLVRFDGFIAKADGVIEMIDAKTRLMIVPKSSGAFVPEKVLNQLRRQSAAVAQNGPEFRCVMEVLTPTAQADAIRILRQEGITNIIVRVR